jgi:hypothetical protein
VRDLPDTLDEKVKNAPEARIKPIMRIKHISLIVLLTALVQRTLQVSWLKA